MIFGGKTLTMIRNMIFQVAMKETYNLIKMSNKLEGLCLHWNNRHWVTTGWLRNGMSKLLSIDELPILINISQLA